jgi:hypothetical protein
MNELYKYSDPEEVNRRADELYLPGPVHPSSRKDKKYMIFDGTRMVHFGQMGYEDATHHKNQKRIQVQLSIEDLSLLSTLSQIPQKLIC